MSPLDRVRAEGERLEAALEAGAQELAGERIGRIRWIVDEALPSLPAVEAGQILSFAADLLQRLSRKSIARRECLATELAALRRAAAYHGQSSSCERHAWALRG